MEKNKQQQKVDSNSEAYQSGGDLTINQGLQYKEVKEIALDVFKSNFYDLGGKVNEIVEERAELVITRYLDKLKSSSTDTLDKTVDPDIRYVIYEAQKNHARRGDEDIAELMTDLLVDRTLADDNDFLKIVCNETLEVIPKLTKSQINLLTAIFIIRYVNLSNFKLRDIAILLSVFSKETNTNEFSFQHLSFLGCINISIGEVAFSTALKHYFQFEGIEDDYEYKTELARNDERFTKIISFWDDTKCKHSSLTSVGIAVAVVNFNQKIGSKWDLNQFLKM